MPAVRRDGRRVQKVSGVQKDCTLRHGPLRGWGIVVNAQKLGVAAKGAVGVEVQHVGRAGDGEHCVEGAAISAALLAGAQEVGGSGELLRARVIVPQLGFRVGAVGAGARAVGPAERVRSGQAGISGVFRECGACGAGRVLKQQPTAAAVSGRDRDVVGEGRQGQQRD